MEISRGTYIYYEIASPRLYYLKQLRQCDVALVDQLMFYKSVNLPLSKYACHACLTDLTKHDTDTFENIS